MDELIRARLDAPMLNPNEEWRFGPYRDALRAVLDLCATWTGYDADLAPDVRLTIASALGVSDG